MGWIRYPVPGGLQAVHKRAGREVTQYLRYSDFVGGEAGAHAVARRWLRWCQHVAPATGLHSRSANEYPVGVSSREVAYSDRLYLRLHVHWHNGRRPANKTFHVGDVEKITEADVRIAERAACAFRAAYVAHREHGTPFDPSAWRNWREAYADRGSRQTPSVARTSSENAA